MRVPSVLCFIPLVVAATCAWAEGSPADKGQFKGKPVTHWLSELAKDDLTARRHAVYALFRIGAQARNAAEPLAHALGDEDDYVRDTAYMALVGLDAFTRPVVTILRSHLNDGRSRVRQLGMWALIKIEPAAAFSDDDFDVRKAAIAVVVNANDFLDERVFQELVGRLQDEDGEVRALAANAVGNAYCFHMQERPYLDTPKVSITRALVRMAGADEDAVARQWSVYALGWIEKFPRGPGLSDSIMPVLVAGARDKDPDVRWQSFIAMGGVGHKDASVEAAFLAGLRDTETKVRTAAASWVGSVSEGEPSIVAALIPLLDDQDRSLRRAAARALGAFGDEAASAVPALVARLRIEKSVGVLASVAVTLGELGPIAREAIPLLESLFLSSKEPHAGLAYALVRLQSAKSEEALKRLVDVALSDVGGRAQYWLGRLGERSAPAVPRLLAALADGGPSAQVEAVCTLGALGVVALPAVPALEAVVKKDGSVNEALVSAAREALKMIRQE